MVVRETTLRIVELVRRDTEVEEDTIDPVRRRAVRDDAIELPEVAPYDEAAGISARLSNSIRVAINSDNAKVSIVVKECTAMAPTAEGRVDDPTGRCRFEEIDDLGDHHGVVVSPIVRGLIHGQSPGALAPTWKRAE